jgi:hypothetical protein
MVGTRTDERILSALRAPEWLTCIRDLIVDTYGVLIPPPLGIELTAFNARRPGQCSRQNRKSAHRYASTRRLNRWRSALLITIFFSLTITLLGAQTPSALSCSSSYMTGAGTDACTVTLTEAAWENGQIVRLWSNNSAVTIPATVTVPAGNNSVGFTAMVSSVNTAETVTLNAHAHRVSQSFSLALSAATTLSVASSSSPSIYGNAVTFAATISSGPTGTVTFYDGGAAIGTGPISGTTATFTTSALTAGSHTITASWPGNSSYSAVTSGAIAQVVNQAKPAITWNTLAAITYGTALSSTQLSAFSTVAGTFSYSPAAGTVLTAGSHTIMATFTPTDTTDYVIATSSVSITVNAATPAITWATPAAITYGTALSTTQLDATATVAGTFTYSPAAGTVLAVGSQILSVTFTPTDTTDYTSATATVTLTVSQATPVITWATPAAITYGTALSTTQLDATATVAGTFAYSPAAGMVLTAGAQILSVTFTPTDTTDYTSATATVTLTVNQGTSTLSVSATTVVFGNVALNSPATQSVTLTSTGTSPVTVSGATVTTGIGYTLSGPTLPVTLSTGQQTNLEVEFDPTVTGLATGQLTIVSTSSTNPTTVVNLSGTGVAGSYSVDLTWDAPTSSPDPVAGYNVYRAPSGGSSYQLLNTAVVATTAYTDTSVQSGQTYDYIAESVDASGVTSVPSNMASIAIP